MSRLTGPHVRACDDANLVYCVCKLVRAHPDPSCQWRRSATCAVPIECEGHGRDVCRVCDPCTCRREGT